MGISVLLLWQAHPLYPLLLLVVNRDEYLDRETEPLKWWQGGKMLGGRDVTAGGTWLASSREGKVALVTNVREVKSISAAKSRGHLPVRFLQVCFHFGVSARQLFVLILCLPAFISCLVGACLPACVSL
ncbi:putative transport and Golgi organization protein [Helianthus debilis subsp. tardiflorus]